MNLSQDEINAMLTGQSDDGDAGAPAGDIISPEEEAALAGPAASAAATFAPLGPQYDLTPVEIDTLGEVGNICMGAVATTMYTLLDRRVSITTPRVSVHTTREVLAMYQIPFVIVEVEYIEGIEGKNMLLLKEPDAALITDLLMGGDGHIEEPIELNELHMSAINEIMNQMIGASATALSKLLGMPVNISPPVSDRVEFTDDVSAMLDNSSIVVKISFDMEIEGLLNSQLLQLIPFTLSREMAEQLSHSGAGGPSPEPAPAPSPAPATPAAAPPAPPAAPAPAAMPAPADMAMPPMTGGYPPPYYPPYPYPQQPYPAAPPYYGHPEAPAPGNLVDVRPMQYASFDGGQGSGAAPGRGIDLVHDIPLQVSVELGKTKKDISDILDFGVGTVVVLDKMAGDPVEIVVNGKLIARGEVVVIDDNYGVRITDLVNG